MFTRKLVAAALFIVTAAACGSDKEIIGPDTVEGTYMLQSAQFDGKTQTLPIVVFEAPGYKVEVTYSDYVLNANGTFTNTVKWKETEGGVVSTSQDISSGTYTVNGATLSFVSPGGDIFSGTRSGGTLTLTFVDEGETMVAVYERS